MSTLTALLYQIEKDVFRLTHTGDELSAKGGD
jgi:hypothetical protein